MTEIVMPRLSDSMEEGTIIRWLKAEGEAVARGDELVEIETDKATMTYESDAAGTLEILAAGGRHAAGRRRRSRDVGRRRPPATGRRRAGRRRRRRRRPRHRRASRRRPRSRCGAPVPVDAEALAEPRRRPAPRPTQERVKASPVARRVARERGVDLAALTGTGPGGRIVKATSRPRGRRLRPRLRRCARTGAAAPPAPARPPTPPVSSAPAASGEPRPAARATSRSPS